MEEKKLKILTEVLGDYKRVNDEYLFFCPFCKHHKAKLSVTLQKGVKCWVCNWASPKIFRIVRRMGNRQQRDAWKELEGTIEIGEFSDDLFDEIHEEEIETIIKMPTDFSTLTRKNLPRTATFPLRYLKKRGVDEEDILYWKIGYCTEGEYRNRIIIPSFNNEGELNYFMARTYINDWPAYKNPPVKKDLVFNELWIDWNKPVALVEGIFDAIKAGANSIPLLGSSLTERSKIFQSLIKHDAAVYMALDDDAAKKEAWIAKKLLEYDVELYKVDVSGYNDVGEMSKEEFLERKSKAPLIGYDFYLNYHTSTL